VAHPGQRGHLLPLLHQSHPGGLQPSAGLSLDGGRILRSILWGAKDNLRWATRISSGIGAAFGLGLIFLGVLRFVAGDVIGGVWMFLIGMFLRNAAQMSYQQLLVRKALEANRCAGL